jgi:hypothetical protein
MRTRRRSPTIKLGPPQLAVVLSGLLTVAFVQWALMPYDWADLYYRDVVIPRMQESHGFGWGAVTFECPGRSTYVSRGVVSVVPDGRFARLGIRPGDVPWGFHGYGYGILRGALEAADRGRFTDVDMINAHDCRSGGEGFRTISLHPKVRETPTALSAGSLLPSPQGTLAIGATRPERSQDPYAVWVMHLESGDKKEVWSYQFYAKATWSSNGRWLAITDDIASSRCVLLDVAPGTTSNPIERLSALPAAARPLQLDGRLQCEVVGWVRDEPTRLAMSVFNFDATPGERWQFDYFFDVTTGSLIPAASR